MIGQTISHCRAVEKLGCGETGVVYKAEELWKDADPDIPVLKQAKAEYAKLQ